MYDGSFKKFPGAYLIACVKFFYSHIYSLIKYLLRLHYAAVPVLYAKRQKGKKEEIKKKTTTGYFSRGFEKIELRNYIKVNFVCFY